MNAAVLTISDSRSKGITEDRSGPAADSALANLGLTVIERVIVPDEAELIRSAVLERIGRVALIVTTGGTGISERDVTPDIVEPLFEKRLPGFGEIMRTGTYGKTPLAIISRGGAGIIGRTLVVMLPGSPKGVLDCLALLGPAICHVLKVLNRLVVDCQLEQGSNRQHE
ncbi:MAG: MogA/MoaB family molybdenum cofactor biosynthesis protein [Phycisphaerae bacterium]|nr:MogA/MoaB family molybdenum cofactor biosynthesis protein [Phycisphaerae bacterium]